MSHQGPNRLLASLVAVALVTALCAGLFGASRLSAQGVSMPVAPEEGEPISSVLLTLATGQSTAFLPPYAVPGDHGPSPAVFPPQEIPFRFNHKTHVLDLGLTCTDCHRAALTSAHSGDDLLPAGTACDRCHGTDHSDPARMTVKMPECGLCHEPKYRNGIPIIAPIVIPKPNLHFSHQAHAVRNIGCQQCHGHVEEVGLATRAQLPRMQGCLRCHHLPEPSAGDAKGECTTCHLTEKTGSRLKTRFPTGALVPPAWLNDSAHDADWIFRHRVIAGIDSASCATCHEERECLDCHDGRVTPDRIHPNDWLHLHAVAGAQDSPRCSSCHRYQSFCVTCHLRSGVTMTGPSTLQAERGRFHPPLWEMQHGRSAQKNLNACVSCHIERDCVICHASGTAGGAGQNPHGPGFSGTCAQAYRNNKRPCLVCHGPADPNLLRCR